MFGDQSDTIGLDPVVHSSGKATPGSEAYSSSKSHWNEVYRYDVYGQPCEWAFSRPGEIGRFNYVRPKEPSIALGGAALSRLREVSRRVIAGWKDLSGSCPHTFGFNVAYTSPVVKLAILHLALRSLVPAHVSVLIMCFLSLTLTHIQRAPVLSGGVDNSRKDFPVSSSHFSPVQS